MFGRKHMLVCVCVCFGSLHQYRRTNILFILFPIYIHRARLRRRRRVSERIPVTTIDREEYRSALGLRVQQVQEHIDYICTSKYIYSTFEYKVYQSRASRTIGSTNKVYNINSSDITYNRKRRPEKREENVKVNVSASDEEIGQSANRGTRFEHII